MGQRKVYEMVERFKERWTYIVEDPRSAQMQINQCIREKRKVITDKISSETSADH
jgi:hypothetical protein